MRTREGFVDDMICFRCREKLQVQKTSFRYMGYEFNADVPRCPKCGQTYIDEALVRGRMAEVETEMEDK
jgi:predicted Zn-ribbon and HTH transcriptional regulator